MTDVYYISCVSEKTKNEHACRRKQKNQTFTSSDNIHRWIQHPVRGEGLNNRGSGGAVREGLNNRGSGGAGERPQCGGQNDQRNEALPVRSTMAWPKPQFQSNQIKLPRRMNVSSLSNCAEANLY
jgi:hypothetical protein